MNLVLALLRRGDEVVVYGLDDLPAGAAADLGPHIDRYSYVRGDVRDRAQLRQAFTASRIDAVIHGAAITSGPDRERSDPQSIMDVNLGGTLAVLEVSRDHGVGRFIYTSSNAVYGESWYTQDTLVEASTPAIPVSIYGASKYASELSCTRLGELWEMDVVSARIGTVFGPWERDTGVRDRLSPHLQIASVALQGRAIMMPLHIPRLAWVYVLDVAEGVLALLDAPHLAHQVYNIGSAMEWGNRILHWCDALERDYPACRPQQVDIGSNIVFHEGRDRAPESISRISGELGFHPRFGPEAAYEHYATWIRSHPDFWSHQTSRTP
jgi:UDP-glucose 4-epimerase